MILERDIERKLIDEVSKRGGKVIKQTGYPGIPDRLVLAPMGICVFVELKRPGQKPRKLQEHRIKELKTLGFEVRTIDSFEGVQDLIRAMF